MPPRKRRPRRPRRRHWPNATPSSPDAANPAAATPITISCRTAASTSPGRIRRRKSSSKIDQQYTEFLDQERRNSVAAAAAAEQQKQQQQRQRQTGTAGHLSSGNRESPPAGGSAQPAGASRRQRYQEPVRLPPALLLLRMASAFRGHQGPEEDAVRRFPRQQGQARVDFRKCRQATDRRPALVPSGILINSPLMRRTSRTASRSAIRA